MVETFTDKIRKEFEENDKVTIYSLYRKLSQDPEIELDPEKTKTLIRTTIYRLQKNKEIIKVDKGTYQKLS